MLYLEFCLVRGDGNGIVNCLTLPVGTWRVGRDEADIVIPHESVSRQHAIVNSDGARAWITDIGSRNGTRINGAPIPPHCPTPLPVGGTVALGAAELKILAQESFRMAEKPQSPAKEGRDVVAISEIPQKGRLGTKLTKDTVPTPRIQLPPPSGPLLAAR